MGCNTLLLFLSVTFTVNYSNGYQKNACKTYTDYFFMNYSPNCYYDPNIFSNQKEIIQRYTNTNETHEVTTEDGYILGIHRLQQKKPKGVVVLLHPVTTDGIIFLLEGKNSPAIRFYEEGYDVWIPNHRGTPYSQKHVDKDNKKYWKFGFHEIGIYDYSAIINFIGRKTGRNDLIVIGHSMSSTSSLVYASLKPREAEKFVKVFILMSPTAFFKYLESPLQLLCPFNEIIENFLNKFRFYTLLTPESYETIFIKFYATNPMKHLFNIFNDFLFGGYTMDYDPTIINNLVSNCPKSSSMGVLYHYAQICKGDGLFRMYDYQRTENMEVYGSEVPPEYPVEDISVPIHLMASKADTCSTVKDSDLLYGKLSEKARKYGKNYSFKYNHLGFHTSRNRYDVYHYILQFIHNINK